MRQRFRSLRFVTLAGMMAATAAASPAEAGDCRSAAVAQLRALSPGGFAIYERTRDRSVFTSWITCEDVPLALSTAVHESVHAITADADAFPLVGGGDVPRPHEVSRFYPPSRLAKNFPASDFVSTYLRPGRASSSGDFLYLLDELNAYTHDLNAAIDLRSMQSSQEEVDNRDGLAALMAFVSLYIETAETSEPATWSGLQTPEVAAVVSEIWGHAERVMASSCGIPNFGREDKAFLGQVCQAETQGSLQVILRRAPVCPTACLTAVSSTDEATPDLARDTNEDGTVASRRGRTSAVRLSTARIFMNRRTTRPEDETDDGTLR